MACVEAGHTVMAAKIDPQGKIVDLRWISGLEALCEATLKAVSHWTYRPYLLDGKPVFVQTTITLNIDFGR